jgi:hypothetical protein
MNCGLCRAHLRDKNVCPGCRGDDRAKMKSCRQCAIKNCEKHGGVFCYGCVDYPCDRLKHLDKRYRTKYSMSMLENLDFIRQSGLNAFVEKEKKRWACPNCGAMLCVHKDNCPACDYQWRRV